MKKKDKGKKAFSNSPKPYHKKPKLSTESNSAQDMIKDLFGDK